MNMINPLKEKYFNLYWEIAYAAASQSTATRRQVGACLVTPSGMISIGWNGMPPGFDNECEGFPHPNHMLNRPEDRVTKPEVIHAERNAIDKMTRQGVSTYGAFLFVTTLPCFECAKSIHGLGLAAIYYDDIYRDLDGKHFLENAGVPTFQRESQ